LIVCSCNNISDDDVRKCAARSDCHQTPNEIYKALGHRPNCGTCARTIRAIVEDVHAMADDGESCSNCPVRAQIEASKSRIRLQPAPVYDFLVAAE